MSAISIFVQWLINKMDPKTPPSLILKGLWMFTNPKDRISMPIMIFRALLWALLFVFTYKTSIHASLYYNLILR